MIGILKIGHFFDEYFLSDYEKMEFGRHKVDQRIFDSFIKSTFRILEKLDLSVVEGGMLQEVAISRYIIKWLLIF